MLPIHRPAPSRRIHRSSGLPVPAASLARGICLVARVVPEAPAARGVSVALAASLTILGSTVWLPTTAAAQDPSLRGIVVQESNAPVSGASITVSGSQNEIVAGPDGRFRISGLGPGEHTLLVSAQGFRAVERRVTVPRSRAEPAEEAADRRNGGKDDHLVRVVLERDPVALQGVTVTGTRKRESVAESSVKVQVVPTGVLQRNATNNLAEAIQYVNGLYNQVDCGVCYTNSIRINGMEGPYTAVLIDGMPLMSSLASVYGLNGINPALVEQIEVIKGPSSTLYGSEAMAGVVNVITKDPRFTPKMALDASATSDAEANVDFALSTEPGEVSGLFSGNLAYNDRFVDDNGDGFSDFPLNRRGVLFGKADFFEDGVRRGSLSAKYLYEDRFGGVEAWTDAHRGSSSVYGESIYTNRAEVVGSWLPAASDAFRVEGSYTWHDQDSFYGDTRYDAVQHIVYGNLVWSARKGPHDLLAGATLRHQVYDDNTTATDQAERRFIPGVFVQDEFEWSPSLSFLGGLRADHHESHGTIFSPRLAMKWSPLEHTTFRLNGGTGFRVVNLFTEDHAALTGSRDVVIASELDPERSRSVTLNVNQVIEFGPNPMMIDLDLFHTRFSNKIVPDYDQDPNLIVYDNLTGHAVSRGVSLSFNQNVDFDRFLYTLGITYQDVYSLEAGVREDEFFAPEVRVVGSATYTFRSLPLKLDYTGSVTGPMRLPSYEEPFARPERSPAYSLHNVQASWRVDEGSEVYLSVKNLFDYVQPSALVDPANPFSDSFDTAYVYGPLRGRYLLLGFRYGLGR